VPPGLGIGAQASPSHEPLLSEPGILLGGPFCLAWGLMAGGHGFASHGGVTLSRGWPCHRWKPLDIPGTHLHSATQLLNVIKHTEYVRKQINKPLRKLIFKAMTQQHPETHRILHLPFSAASKS